MNEYFSRLEELIAIWEKEIELHTKSGSTDKNKYSEYIAVKLLNAAFSLNLEILPKNSAAVDLGDKKAGIAFQITSRTDSEKIEANLQAFAAQNLVLDYPQGIQFLLLVNQKPRWREDTKKKFNGLLPGFEADRDIYTFPSIIEALKKNYLNNSKVFSELLDMMEMQFGNKAGEEPLEMTRQKLQDGSLAYYEALRGPNGRFRYLKISDILFTGTETKWLDTNVDIDNEKFYGGPGPAARGAHKSFSKEPLAARRHSIIEVLPILWKLEVKHALIIGEGGMGKTVSLLQWWENLLESGEKLKPVPMFIALNEFNQVSETKQEGFILETIRKNYGLGKITLEQIESLMKTPLQEGEEFIPSIVLLLDGFNEITAEKRQLLIELNQLAEQFPGIQVIMTSRNDMRGNFNWNHWHPVRLKELEEDQVKTYLQEHGMTGTIVSGKGRLGKLIKNPMMLTLFTASCEVHEKHRDTRYCSFKDRVESPGELLWNFIEAQVALLQEKVGPGEDRVFYYWFLLKYLLPGLGFEMEKAGLFAFTYSQFREHLDKLCHRFSQGEFLDTVPQLGRYVKVLPVGECKNEVDGIERAAFLRDIFCGEMHMLVEEGETLRFLHQDFRDFFAAVHILNELEVGIRKKEIPGVMKERILDYYVQRYIGEIEGEHRCIPYLVKGEGWKIDINRETRLHRVVDICRGKLSKVFGSTETFFQKWFCRPEVKGNVGYSVWNIVEVWKAVRGELTGADLSSLDLTGVMLNGVRCSRYYEGEYRDCVYLAAVFDGSRVHEKSLLPQGHSEPIFSAVYSSDGKKILSASLDNTIKEWDAGTGECLKTLAGNKSGVTNAVYSSDGKKILSALEDNTIKEWDAETDQYVRTLKGHTAGVKSAVYSPDGKKILSASFDNTIKEWSAETGEYVRTLKGHTAGVKSAVYSPDGKKILSASWDNTIKEWDPETGECLKTLVGHASFVNSAVYNGDGKKILSASSDNTIKEWDTETGQCVKTLAGHKSWVDSAVYSPDGEKILSASGDNTIKEWNAGTGVCVKTLAGHKFFVNSAVYTLDGKKILSASNDSTIKEWDAETGECVKTLGGCNLEVTRTVVSPDGKRIIFASSDCSIKEWEIKSWKCIQALGGHTSNVNSAVYSPDEEKNLSASFGIAIENSNLETGKLVWVILGHPDEIRSVIYSRDGKKILSISSDSTIKEWDAETGQCIKIIVGHPSTVNSVVYSPDGRKILSASDDSIIRELDMETGECLKNLAGHTDKVTSAVYSGDGKKILSESWDGTIREWDAGTGQCLKTHHNDDKPNLSEYPSIKDELETYDVPVAPGKKIVRELLNIPGLFIQGCSFQNLEKESKWTKKGLKILRMYGGRV